jgi:hypothetical protein
MSHALSSSAMPKASNKPANSQIERFIQGTPDEQERLDARKVERTPAPGLSLRDIRDLNFEAAQKVPLTFAQIIGDSLTDNGFAKPNIGFSAELVPPANSTYPPLSLLVLASNKTVQVDLAKTTDTQMSQAWEQLMFQAASCDLNINTLDSKVSFQAVTVGGMPALDLNELGGKQLMCSYFQFSIQAEANTHYIVSIATDGANISPLLFHSEKAGVKKFGFYHSNGAGESSMENICVTAIPNKIIAARAESRREETIGILEGSIKIIVAAIKPQEATLPLVYVTKGFGGAGYEASNVVGVHQIGVEIPFNVIPLDHLPAGEFHISSVTGFQVNTVAPINISNGRNADGKLFSTEEKAREHVCLFPQMLLINQENLQQKSVANTISVSRSPFVMHPQLRPTPAASGNLSEYQSGELTDQQAIEQALQQSLLMS